MKIRVVVQKRKSILDPEGETIRRALDKASLDVTAPLGVRVGKTFDLDFDPGLSEEQARAAAKSVADALLVNAVMEDFSIEVLS